MVSSYFYRAMALMLTVGALSKIQKIERREQARSEKFAKLLEYDDKTVEPPLVWLVEGERWEAPGHPQGFLLLNWGETEQNRTIPYMVLKAKVNDRRKFLALSRVEIRGPRSDFIRQGMIETQDASDLGIPKCVGSSPDSAVCTGILNLLNVN
ncbi:hypothetical protein TNCV_1248761 [Trichonephila clavipes]|nr:hypothetical protein TNCV_1248761 [Trichonephila clavipes]